MKNKLKRLKEMMSPGYDWDKHCDRIDKGEDEDLDDLFRECFNTFTIPGEGLSGFRCTGFNVQDTPKSLYRALYLGLPSIVDFSDMYKSGTLFGFKSVGGNFFSAIAFYKYELNVYNYCKNKNDISGQPHGIRGGWASCDNGIYCISDVGNLWFETLKLALEFEHDVYAGNEFKV